MSSSVRDTLCKHNPASDETEHVCDWCQSIIDFQPRKGWQVHLPPEQHERAITLIGDPSATSARKWNTLSDNSHHLDHVQWARLPEPTEPILQPPHSWDAFQDLADAVLRGDGLSLQQEAMLREGIVFHDESTLRYLDSTWNLNGIPLPGLSLFVAFSLFGDAEKREGWDIPALLLCVTSVNPEHRQQSPMIQRYLPGPRNLRPPYRPLASMLTWLSTRLQVDRTLDMRPEDCVPMMAWAHDIQTRMFERQPRNMEGMFRKALSNHPPGLFHVYDSPWMRAWQSLESNVHQSETQKWALDLNAKALRFRIRTKSGLLRLIKVPSQPALWALLSSLSLSPLNSEAGSLLMSLQHNWAVPYVEEPQPSKPLIRSMEFCHEIMNGLDQKVFLQHAQALIIGRLGHVYEVAVGHGQHGAPYTIQHVIDIEPSLKHPICIHSGRFSNTLPLGDTMGGVVLSMVNDVVASEQVDSLESLLFSQAPFGFPRQSIPRPWLDALDVEGLSQQLGHPYLGEQLRWYRREIQQEPARRQGQGLHELLLRNRFNGRNRSRTSERWVARFHTVFDREGRFPHDELVAEWRTTVTPYLRGHEPKHMEGEFFGRFEEGYFNRRYHHLMPHRRMDDIHEEGDIRDGERRWCEVFARVWEVLIHQPLGATFSLPAEDGLPITFEHAALQVTVRSDIERQFLMRIGRVLGYVKHDDSDAHSMFIRRDHPRPNARLQLTDLLRDAQQRQRVRGAPPRWWNYVDVVAPPYMAPHFRWQLQIDHRDARRPIQAGRPGDEEFNPGGLFG